MPIEQVTPQEAITQHLAQRVARFRAALIYRLTNIGEAAVEAARRWQDQSSPYTDRTGNLRSSIGYVVAIDGQIMQTSGFEQVKSTAAQGAQEGKAFAQSLVQQFSRGAVVIVVAGMRYAKHVADRGFDVLDSGQLVAEKEAARMLKDLGLK